MSGTLVGGDEVNAIVLDVGTYQVKAGYAGEDTPKFVFPSAIGVGGEAASNGGDKMDVDGRKIHVGTHALGFRRDGMEVQSPFTDGIFSDWEAIESLWDHALKDQMRLSTEEHPMLLAEPSHNTPAAREKMVELMFEKYNVPAVFLAKNAVLSSFATARQTSLVVDVGHESTVVTAVHDGYALAKSIIRTPLAGHLLTRCMQHSVESTGTAIRPRYEFRRTETSTPGKFKVEYTNYPGVTPSYRAYQVEAICQDIKHGLCRVSETPFNPEENGNIPPVTYELPDGQEIQIGASRFTVPEILFNPSLLSEFGDVAATARPQGSVASQLQGLPAVVAECIGRCDVDIRRELYNGVVLTGGTSLFASLRDRLEKDLSETAPAMMRVKVAAATNAIERRYSTWIGGSILASLGTFQQMWMSKAEFKEHGAGLIHKKSP